MLAMYADMPERSGKLSPSTLAIGMSAHMGCIHRLLATA